MKTRKLERAYRRDKSENSYQVWRQQSTFMRHYFQQRYIDYWRSSISDSINDPKALWSKISALLDASQASSSATAHTADAFANHFQSKVSVIRNSTSNAPHPRIDPRPSETLQTLREVTMDEVTKVVSGAPVKHCALDPAPTWLVKRLLPLLADAITRMCNASLSEGVFPSILKQAIVKPRLKKPTLNPDDLNSYRPISNLSFISKVVERVVAAIVLSAHFESQDLLPSRQSAYRANHSTETAITAVYDEIVRAVWCLTLWTTRHCLQYFIDVSPSVELRWTGVETTYLTARRLSKQGHSYLDLTTSSVVCPKGPCWAQRSSSPI